MGHSLAFGMVHGSTGDPTQVLVFLVAIVTGLVGRYWRFFDQWVRGIRGHDWAAMSATVDIVSVVHQTQSGEEGEHIVGYLATLTYFYRNPDLQVGDYSRMFGEEWTAEAWTASYKGKTVIVRVDPSDPTRSVLRKEEL